MNDYARLMERTKLAELHEWDLNRQVLRLHAENERLRAVLLTVRDHYRVHPQCCPVADQITTDGLVDP